MKSRNGILLMVGLLTVATLGLGSAATEYPFVGLVSGDNVNVRSGPDINYYPVVKLMRNNRVQVLGEEAGWYKIVPPPGCYSLVDKSYVEKTSDNKGVITGDKVMIRAGSMVSTARKYSIQMLAGKGMEVTIIGQEGDLYKITPPDGACVWLAKDYVKPLTAQTERSSVKAEANEATPAIEDDEMPADQDAEGVKSEKEIKSIKSDSSVKVIGPVKQGASELAKVTTKPAEEPQVPGVARVTRKMTIKTATGPGEEKTTEITTFFDSTLMGKFAEPLTQADELFMEEMKKPLKDRDFSKAIAILTPIAEQTENAEAAKYAKSRLTIIENQKDNIEGLTKLYEIQKNYKEEISQIRVPHLKDYKESEVAAAQFQGLGVLRPSLVFSGPLMPERFRLFDTEKCRTVAYVEIAPDVKIHISDYIGKKVAVYGTSTIDAKLGYRVIQASLFKVIPEPATATNVPSVID
jgi:uncharacterized protein YgiM (DUF1202 family)